jgi:hypothetical protein
MRNGGRFDFRHQSDAILHRHGEIEGLPTLYQRGGDTYIACMDDQFRALKRFDGFGTQQTVRIRNDANDVELVQALGSLR